MTVHDDVNRTTSNPGVAVVIHHADNTEPGSKAEVLDLTTNASVGDDSDPDGGIMGVRGLRGGDERGSVEGVGFDGLDRAHSHKLIDGNVRDVQPVHIPLDLSIEGEIHATQPEVKSDILVGQSQPQHQNGLIHGL